MAEAPACSQCGACVRRGARFCAACGCAREPGKAPPPGLVTQPADSYGGANGVAAAMEHLAVAADPSRPRALTPSVCGSCGTLTAAAFCGACGAPAVELHLPVPPDEADIGPQWNQGAMSRAEAEAILFTCPVGTFLVRESSTGGHAISITDKGTVRHFAISKQSGQVYVASAIDKKRFSSLAELALHYKTKGGLASDLTLTATLGEVSPAVAMSGGPLRRSSSKRGSQRQKQSSQNGSASAATRPTYRSLKQAISTSSRILELMDVGQRILHAQDDGVLNADQVGQLREIYKQQRLRFAQGLERHDWVPDHTTSTCMGCTLEFKSGRRRHHCRSCGLVLCKKCMSGPYRRMGLSLSKVCLKCHRAFDHILQEAKVRQQRQQEEGNKVAAPQLDHQPPQQPPQQQMRVNNSQPPSPLRSAADGASGATKYCACGAAAAANARFCRQCGSALA